MRTSKTPVRKVIFDLYDRTIDVIIMGLVFVMLVLLLISFLDVILNIKTMLVDAFGAHGGEIEFRSLVGNVLDVFVVIELFNTFMGYMRTRHIRLSMLLDVTIVFALREMLLKLYDHAVAMPVLLMLGGVILVLVICRTLTHRFPSMGSKNNPD